MAAIPRDLIESELFGHEKGAFTGANSRSAGRFEQAEGGTLFLDEIGDMPMEAQTRLLRVLQQGEYTTVGGRTPIKTNVRIVAATNKDLRLLIQQGLFREDLFFRLNVVPIQVPPLRERRADIPELISFFLAKINREMGTSITALSPDARDMLIRHNWPGNVRELENTLVRAAVLASGPTLMPRDLALAAQEPTPALYGGMSLEEIVRMKLKEYFRQTGDVEPSDLYALIIERIERPLIELTLERTGGNQLQAAAILGINRNTLRKKIAALKITPRRTAAQD
jgi:two-component system nitrogen regulation response regulator GlnG